ncbi:hypothetical protein BCF59_0524 [Mycoplasmopsis mustelae]|uniref:NERD domain-containing protein n=1 Tax=Mycoplasmopsis mustelae TaxID=171289 RepID=A0A4R7UEG7_9BACT|nr:hypothetical protein [Mycoplasmopsis mustelae]TDV23533.1 hypothetical protein BCF59_0524 [Mycoplasmopsis mustelae]
MSFLTIIIFVLGGILFCILIGVIIWRIWLKYNKKDDLNIQNYVGYTSKTTIEKLKILNALSNAKVLSNILVKNPFAKKKYTLFSAIVVSEHKIYILSDILKNSKFKLIINNNGAFIENKKLIKQDKWEIFWLKEMSGWLDRRFKNQYEIIIFSDENLNFKNVKNQTTYRIMNLNEINDEIINNKNKEINTEKVTEIFLKNNLFNEIKK